MRKPILAFFTIIFLISTLTACSIAEKVRDPYANYTAAELYAKASNDLKKGKYNQAITFYQALQGHFPFGELTNKADLQIIYAYYKNDQNDSAYSAAEHYINMHPNGPYLDYAYYMKGLTKLYQNSGFITHYINIDQSLRDTTNASQAFLDFQSLINNFPESGYTSSARQQMIYIKNALASHELSIATYYLKRKAYVASANRAISIIENYQGTPASYAALNILAKSYQKLNLTRQLAAINSIIVLNNHPKKSKIA